MKRPPCRSHTLVWVIANWGHKLEMSPGGRIYSWVLSRPNIPWWRKRLDCQKCPMINSSWHLYCWFVRRFPNFHDCEYVLMVGCINKQMNIAPFNRLSDSNFEDTTMRPGTCHCHCLCHCRYSTERFTGIEFFSNLQAILNTILQIL